VRTALLLVGTGLGWLALAGLLGADRGSFVVALSGYGAAGLSTRASSSIAWSRVASGPVGHPLQALRTLADHWINVASVVGPAGWIGIFTAWTLGVPLVVILENNISGFGLGLFSSPGFQSSPVFGFSAVGLIIIVAWAVQRWRLRAAAAGAIAGLFALNALLWAGIWIPQTKSDWLQISSAQSAVLDRALAQIPEGDEVVVSQGVAGRFALRPTVYDLTAGNNHVPVTGSTVWFVVAPNAGIETQPVNGAQHVVAALAGPMKARLVEQGRGIWVFRWHRPPGRHLLVFPGAVNSIPAWVSPGAAGLARLDGSPWFWRVEGSGQSGYVVSGDYWQRFPGQYDLQVRLAVTGVAWIEVWDDNDNSLLLRQEVQTTAGNVTVSSPVTIPRGPQGPSGYRGVGPFVMQRVPPVPGQSIEIRVFTPGGGACAVYLLGLSPQLAYSTSPT